VIQACHQVIGVFASRDAVGGHTVEVQRALRALGFESEIFAAAVADGADHPVRALDELPPDDGATVLLFQASAATPAADVVLNRPEPLVVNYHNVTPSAFFSPWEPAIAAELLAARTQIGRLARPAAAGVADSAYNGRELAAMGCRDVRVVPVLIDLDRLGRDTGPPTASGLGARWLFVGRLCPNKAQHDVVTAFAAYRATFDPAAALTLVGRSSSHRYETALRSLVDSLGLGDAVELIGSIGDDELGRQYRSADVFVCLSEHEGFCNTVVEAMASGTPVVAYASSALPETVGAGGLLLDRKDPSLVATAVHRVVADGAVRAALIEAGARRAAELDLDEARRRLHDTLRDLLR
jgi:glycosyltransferase involved in cell wall biosynthesis